MKQLFRTCALAIASIAVLNTGTQGQTSQPTSPDNTKVNKVAAPTAQEQANGRSDLETSREIRKAVVGDKTLSTYAHNVKIIARNGQVTLKGPVRTPEEKAAIAAKAAEVAGAANVVNQIEVVPSKTPQK